MLNLLKICHLPSSAKDTSTYRSIDLNFIRLWMCRRSLGYDYITCHVPCSCSAHRTDAQCLHCSNFQHHIDFAITRTSHKSSNRCLQRQARSTHASVHTDSSLNCVWTSIRSWTDKLSLSTVLGSESVRFCRVIPRICRFGSTSLSPRISGSQSNPIQSLL